jgi:hypothetical protein
LAFHGVRADGLLLVADGRSLTGPPRWRIQMQIVDGSF